MIINVKSKTILSSFYVLFNNTVVNEYPNLHGISHLIEHLMSRNMTHSLDDMERYGIEWNAYTSVEHLNFFMGGLNEHVNDYKHIFLNNLLDINITEEMFNKEKKIILQEYEDSFNSQSMRHLYNLYRKYFNFYHVIGNKSDLINLTLEDCIDYYKKYYNNPSNIYNVSKFNRYKKSLMFNDNPKTFVLKKGIYNNELEIQKNVTNYTSLIYVSDIVTKDFNKIKFINMMLSKGLNSPILKEIRGEKSNVYYFKIELDKLTPDCGVILFFTETTRNNIKEITRDIENILKNKEKYITRERFNIMKTYYEIYYKKLEVNKHVNINTYITTPEWSIKTILKNLSFDEIYHLYDKYYNLDNYTRSVDNEEFF
jgi:predicted Zn-dependent peptidase